ncbi:YdcH family protein [Pararhodospirillum oryzae]|nr:YdcH family protein [Pararhodospirillum oryzae]
MDALRSRHAEIDQLVETEEARPAPDDLLLARLKRQKLRLKDELATMETH